MKHESVNYLVVGSFVLAVLAALIISLTLITGRDGDTENYNVYYDSVAGLKYGTIVSYEGYQLGQVESVEPVQDNGKTRYRVTFGIREDWKVPADSIAQIVSSGLLGGISIDIKEGVSKTPLKPGDTLQGQEGADLFAAVGGAAGDIKLLIGDVRKFVRTLNAEAGLLNDARSLLKRLDNSAANLEGMLSENNVKNVTEMISSLNALSQRLDNTLSEVDHMVESSSALVNGNRDDIQRSIRHLSASLEVVSQHINTITYNLESTSRNMNEFSRQIRENPGLLLGSTPPKDKAAGSAK
jgi:phospholipid/cholesterol/gamma-HCH transport system substrate-binding protein